MKATERSEERPWKVIFSLGGAVFTAISVGWLIMMSHVEEEFESNGLYEPALKEPYYSWVHTYSDIYWIAGIACVLFLCLQLKFLREENEHYVTAMVIVGVLLMTSGFLLDFLIALIKLNVTNFAYVYFLLTVGILLLQTLFFFSISYRSFLTVAACIALPVLAAIFISWADPLEGLYISLSKHGNVQGNFYGKVILWILSWFGAPCMIIMHHIFLKTLSKRSADMHGDSR